MSKQTPDQKNPARRWRLIPEQAPRPHRSAEGLSPAEAIQEEQEILGRWTLDLLATSRNHLIRYWLLKAPAVILATASPLIHAASSSIAVTLGIGASVLVMVDGLWPAGQLYAVYRKAGASVRRLQAKAESEWRQAQLLHTSDASALAESAVQIIGIIADERERIDREVTAAEISVFESHDENDQ